MARDESVVKSFRISGDQFERANEIFKKEGFSLSEVIRLVCDATIREGRIPRGLSTKEMESKLDNSQNRENFIDGVLSMAGVVPKKQRDMTTEQRLLKALFNEPADASDLSNEDLREWAQKWGLPDNLSIGVIAELYDCGLFKKDPWEGIYDSNIAPASRPGSNKIDAQLQDAMVTMECQNNITDNLEQIKRQMHAKAVKYLMEYNNVSTDAEEEKADE